MPSPLLLLLSIFAHSQGVAATKLAAQDTLPPPLSMHGDTLVVHPRTPGAHELRLLVTPDTIWLIEGAQRTLATPERARAARASLKVLGLLQRDRAADSAFLAKHPEFRRPKP